MSRTRVLIVDDHPVMRRGLRELIGDVAELEVCGEAEDCGQALILARETCPDVAILDVSLPDGNGLELIKRLHAVDGDLRVLFLSMHDDVLFAERALQAGALGYINKARPGKELLEAIHKVVDGKVALSAAMADRLLSRTVGNNAQPPRGVESLSNRELEVFEMIGRGMSIRDIADRLSVSPKTVEAHREHIKTKLGIDSATELSRFAALWWSRESSAKSIA